jgi:hypothetical protein
MTLEEQLHGRRAEILRMAAKHGAHDIRVFGSVVRGDADQSSDLDFLVELDPGRSLLDPGERLQRCRRPAQRRPKLSSPGSKSHLRYESEPLKVASRWTAASDVTPSWEPGSAMTTIEAVRELALSLPRSYEALVRDRVKFRVGQIVYLSFSRDETRMGFAFPKEEREALVASEPDKFMMPARSDLRYNWVVVRLSAIGNEEMREIVLDAWRMVVPKRVAAEHLGDDA